MAGAPAVYRRVMKAVQKHVGGGADKKHFREFVAAEFRSPVGTEADARARLRLGEDYAYHLTSIQHQKVGPFLDTLTMRNFWLLLPIRSCAYLCSMKC